MKKILGLIILLMLALPVACAEDTAVPPAVKSEKQVINIPDGTGYIPAKIEYRPLILKPVSDKKDLYEVPVEINFGLESENTIIVDDVDVSSFMDNIHKKIRDNWNPPQSAKSSEIVVMFCVNKSGEVSDIKVKENSTGDSDAEKAAIDAIKKAAPFEQFPQNFKYEDVNIRFTFYYNVSEKSELSGVDFAPYMKTLRKRIKRNWKPPMDGKFSKQTVVSFSIGKNGELVSECQIHTSSGDDAMDKAAIDAINKTAPFEPLPAEFKGEKIDIQFTFDYKVLGSFGRKMPVVPAGMLNCRITDNSPSKLTEMSLKNRDKKAIFRNYLSETTSLLESVRYTGNKPSLVKVKFNITKEGYVENVKVRASTGNKEFNQFVLSQIKAMNFGEIPEELGLVMIPVEYQFDNYTYNAELTRQLYKTTRYSGINTGANVVGAGSVLGLFILRLISH